MFYAHWLVMSVTGQREPAHFSLYGFMIRLATIRNMPPSLKDKSPHLDGLAVGNACQTIQSRTWLLITAKTLVPAMMAKCDSGAMDNVRVR